MINKKIFEINQKCSKTKARLGQLKLMRGQLKTPVFMTIGTQGSVKSLANRDLESLDAQIILGNTYHLWVSPGLDILHKAGGLNKFIDYSRPILTDSGGFQAFSLHKNRKFKEEGVKFQVARSGQYRMLTPEVSVQIQTILGSDVMLVLDQALSAICTKQEAKNAMQRTFRWAKRSQQEFERLQKTEAFIYSQNLHGQREFKKFTNYQDIKGQQVLFGIPQGAQFLDFRKKSAELTMELDFPGYSIGGVANGGEPEEIMYSQVLAQTEILEDQKPRHLLGVGTPKDMVQMVARGIDMFDCVYPTRNARHGSLFFEVGENQYQIKQITNQEFKTDFSPINPKSKIPELKNYTKAYLCHLFRVKELLGKRLATLNNLEFYYRLFDKIRAKIEEDTFKDWWQHYQRVD